MMTRAVDVAATDVERHADGVGPGEFRRSRQGASSRSSHLDAGHCSLQLVSDDRSCFLAVQGGSKKSAASELSIESY